MPHLL